jgi:hypothetical protein
MKPPIVAAFVALLALTTPQQQPNDPPKTPAYGTPTEQPKTPRPVQSPAINTEKILVAQAKTIIDLNQRVQDLEQRVQALQAGESDLHIRLAQVEQQSSSKPSTSTLIDLKAQLAGFTCRPEWLSATSSALQDNKPSTTYQGAGALDCTQRLAKIVSEIVENSDKQQ